MSLRSEISSVGGLVLPDADDFLAKLRTSDNDEDKKEQDDLDDNSSPVKTRHNNDSSVKLSSKEISYREKRFPVVKKVMRQELKCTACGTNLRQLIELGGPVYTHPLLGTLMCKNCLEYYGEGEFSVDEDGSDNYCRWCGQGGEMFCCTDCSCVFCKKCTKRNLSRSLLQEIEDSDDWKCFVCNVKPLWDLRAICWAVEEHIDDILKAKKEQTKQKLHLLSAKLKDSPEKPKKRRELKRVQKDSSEADSSDSDIKEKKTGRNKKNDSSNGDSDGSDNSRRSSSLVRRIKVSNKPRSVREKKKTFKESEIEEISSDSDFEETARRKDTKKHSTKNLRARNMSRKAKKSSDSDSESNGSRKLNAKRSTTRVSKPTKAVDKIRSKITDEDSDSSDSDFEKPELRRRPAPKSRRKPTRDSKPKTMKKDDIVSLSDSSGLDVKETKNKGKGNVMNVRKDSPVLVSTRERNQHLKNKKSTSDSSDLENNGKKKKTVGGSPIIRSRAEKEKHMKKVAIVDTDLKKNKIRNCNVDDSDPEESSSETGIGKNKPKPSIGNSESIQWNGTINSKRKLDFASDSKDFHVANSSIVQNENKDVSLPNGLDGSETHLQKSKANILETSVGQPNSNHSSDSEKNSDLPMEGCSSQGSLAPDVILPTTIDKESGLRAQALLQEQCLDLRILSKNLARAAKQIQGRISTEDPAEIHKAIQKIQSLIVKTKENMDHQSSCLKHRGERWTRKVIAKAKVRAKKSGIKGKSVESHATDSLDADGVLQRRVCEKQSNDVNLVGLSRENKKSKNVNVGDQSGASNSEHEDKNKMILDKETNLLNSEEEVVSSKKENVQSENEMSKVIARKSPTRVRENGDDSNGETEPPEGTLENGIMENDQEKLNGELSSQGTQEYQLLLNDVSFNNTDSIVKDTKKKRSRKSSIDIFTDEEDEVINLDDTVNSLDLLGDLDAISDTDKKHTDSGISDVREEANESRLSDNALKDKAALLERDSSDEEPKEKGVREKFTTAALKDKDALLASGSSDDEPLTEAKEKDAKKKFTAVALKDKDALLASGSSDDEPLTEAKEKDAKKKFTAVALKDKDALLASGSSDDETLTEPKEKDAKKKFTAAALKDKDALLASGSSDDEPLTEAKEKDAKKKFTAAALKDKDALLASGSSDDEPLTEAKEKDAKNKFTAAALKDKGALLASGSSDDEPLTEAKEKDAKKKFTAVALKDKDALLASGSSDDEPLTEAKEKGTKKKFTTTALKDKDALLASSSSDDEPLAGGKEKAVAEAKKNRDKSKSKDNEDLSESNASDQVESSKETAPKATPTPSKAKMGPKSRVHKSSHDDSSSLSDFDISVKKRKRRPDGKRKHKKRCVDVDLASFGDNKLSYNLTVNVVKLTEEDLHEHNIHEIPSCTVEGEKKRKRGGRRPSGEDSSDEVNRLLDLKNLKRNRSTRRRRSSAGSDSTASDASAQTSKTKAKAKPASHIKKKKKEDDEQKLVDYLHKKFSDDSDTSDNDEENDNDEVKALKKSANAKKKLEMQKKLAAKQMLLDELMSSSEASDAAQSDKKEDKKKNKKKKGKKDVQDEKEEKKGKVDSDASEGEVAGGDDAQDEDKPDNDDDDDKKKLTADEESENDSSDTARKKKKKKKWRNNKLLKGKLSETDTSDDERKWDAKKKRGEKEKKDSDEEDEEKLSKMARKKPTRKVVGSDSDSDVVAVLSSTSSSSDDDFFPSKKKKPEPSKKGNRDSSDSDSDKPKKKVKRRRIKAPDTDSSGSNDEVNESQKSTPGKGRKNIRRVLKEDSVGEMTRKAAKEEEDRRLRILEKQKLYNQLYDNLQEGVVRTDKLVLDFDPETKKELVSVDTNIVQKLKPHQVKGVKFMWDACFESVKRLQKSPGSGCILAHCMGLGKTFQVVTLVHTLLTNKKTRVKRVLVICPLSTVLNWVNEFNMWLKDTPDDEEIDIFELSKFKQAFERSHQLKEWHERGGVMVLSYDMFRNLSNPKQKRVRKSILDTYKRTLMDPGPDLVICDEGHLLKNEKTAISKAVGMVNTLRRIALTGTPLQNNLGEYHCMVQFVKPNLLGTKKEFSNRFINPITNGQFENSTVHDVKIMKRRAHVLHKMLEGCVQRFDYSVLMPFLPPKQEYVISVRLSDTQIKIYQHYLDNFARGSGRGQNTKLFADFQYMQRIWTHPKVLMWNVEKCERLQLNKEETDSEGSLKDFVVESSEESDEASTKSDEASKSAAEKSGSDREEVVKKYSSSSRSKRLATRSARGASPADPDVQEVEQVQNNPLEWWKEYTKEEDFDDLRLSGKLVLFFSILRECEKIGDKVLVFSQSMFSLDLIEHFLSLIDAETQRAKKDGDEDEGSAETLDHHRGSWARGLDYFRLDGSVSGENRSIACKMFNKEDNLRARLYLISTKAGGLGINLFAANRVIIFDASWNPSHDVQSIFRVYRFGQKKPCYIYRFLASGTMEEKIYERQVTKLSLACRVVDEQQIERHYTSHDLQEMYTFNPEPTKRPTPILPKDRLLAELLKEHEKWIETYHEHDSLLENKCEEELNEDERKAAWDDYENEKKAPAQGLLNANQGMNNYLSYIQSLSPEAIREVLRKENPTATEEQITERVRLLMAAAYKHYEQQQNITKQIQAYHALQNQQQVNQVAFGGNAHPTALYMNNASAMPNMKMFNQGMLGSAGAGHLSGMLQPQNTYNYQNMAGVRTAQHPATSTAKVAGAGAQPFLKVRNFADMQEPARPTFKTVPTIRPLNMNAGSSRGSASMLVKNPLFAAKTISKTPIILGKGGASSSSRPPKSPEVETIDSD